MESCNLSFLFDGLWMIFFSSWQNIVNSSMLFKQLQVSGQCLTPPEHMIVLSCHSFTQAMISIRSLMSAVSANVAAVDVLSLQLVQSHRIGSPRLLVITHVGRCLGSSVQWVHGICTSFGGGMCMSKGMFSGSVSVLLTMQLQTRLWGLFRRKNKDRKLSRVSPLCSCWIFAGTASCRAPR